MKDKIKKWFKKHKNRIECIDKWFVIFHPTYSAFLTFALIVSGYTGTVLLAITIAFLDLIMTIAFNKMRPEWEKAKEKDKKESEEK